MAELLQDQSSWLIQCTIGGYHRRLLRGKQYHGTILIDTMLMSVLRALERQSLRSTFKKLADDVDG